MACAQLEFENEKLWHFVRQVAQLCKVPDILAETGDLETLEYVLGTLEIRMEQLELHVGKEEWQTQNGQATKALMDTHVATL